MNFLLSFLYYKWNCVNCALKMSLLHCLSCSCAQLICPVYQTPPVTTRQCVELCTQKPGSFTRSWRRLRVPKRWVLIFITIMAVGLYCYFFRHINCSLEGLAVWPYTLPYTPWLTWLSVGTTDSVGRVTLVWWNCCCMVPSFIWKDIWLVCISDTLHIHFETHT